MPSLVAPERGGWNPVSSIYHTFYLEGLCGFPPPVWEAYSFYPMGKGNMEHFPCSA